MVYVASLKVDYQRNPRDYKLILQDIASEVASTRKVSISGGASNRNVSAMYTSKGTFLDNGVYTSDGSIFIGSYDPDKWKSESVKPYHKIIR